MRLGRPSPKGDPAGPLLRWGDLRRELSRILETGRFEVTGAAAAEVAGGVSLDFGAGAVVRPPFEVTLAPNGTSATIGPGLVFGGSNGFRVPTCARRPLTDPAVLDIPAEPLVRVWVKLDYEPIVVRKEFDGSPNQGLLTGLYSDYFTWAGFRVTAAEVAAGPTLPATVAWGLNLADGSWTPGVAVGQLARIEGGELVFFSGGVCVFRTDGANPNVLFRKLPDYLTTP